MMKSTGLTVLGIFTLLFSSCDKDNDNDIAADLLINTKWSATLTDDNPATNPPGQFGMNGNNQYYPWLACHMDDTFTFQQKQLTINDNETSCEDGANWIFDTSNLSYSYNAEKKQLTIGEGDDRVTLEVYELNKNRLKLGLPIPMGGAIVFLFKRK